MRSASQWTQISARAEGGRGLFTSDSFHVILLLFLTSLVESERERSQRYFCGRSEIEIIEFKVAFETAYASANTSIEIFPFFPQLVIYRWDFESRGLYVLLTLSDVPIFCKHRWICTVKRVVSRELFTRVPRSRNLIDTSLAATIGRRAVWWRSLERLMERTRRTISCSPLSRRSLNPGALQSETSRD